MNISLDTLDAARYEQITGGGRLNDAIAGVEAALAAGLSPVKLNCVLLRDTRMSDIRALIRFSRSAGVKLRFIELMPLFVPTEETGGSWERHFVPADEIRAKLIGDDCEQVEFLQPVTRPFCGECNRLRLTADGRLLACLCRSSSVDVKGLVRTGADEGELASAFERCLALKPKPWQGAHTYEQVVRMSAIGG